MSLPPVNLLLVDDRPENLLALKAALAPLGANLVRAGSGQEALRLLLKQDFATIILDICMPGWDGFQTAAEIRARKQLRSIPILFLSAVNVSEADVQRGYDLGAVDYMLKPFTPEVLCWIVKAYLDLFRSAKGLENALDALPAAPQATVLVVDDQPANLTVIESMLAPLGEKLILAHSGTDALGLLLKHDVDLILLDVAMPAMDGFETAAMIRQNPRFRHIPILFMSAVQQATKDVVRDYEVGAVDFIFAPCSAECLQGKVRALLDLVKQNQAQAAEHHLREIQRLNRNLARSDADLRHLNETLAQQVEEQTQSLHLAAEDLRQRNAALTIAQQAAETARQRYQDLFEFAPDGYLVTDGQGIIQEANQAATTLLHINPAELAGKPLLDFVAHEERRSFQAELDRLVNGNSLTAAWKATMLPLSGRPFKAALSLGWLCATAQSPSRLHWLIRDITLQENLQTQFLCAQRMESVGRLAGGIAHDLNNILTPIMMGLPLLRRRIKEENLEPILASMETSAQRGADVVKQILTFSRGLEGQRLPVALKPIIREMQQIAQETFPKNIRTDVEFPDNLPLVLGNSTQLHQVLLNLCVNARDAMPEGGTLSMSARECAVDEAFAKMAPDAKPGAYVLLSVADTGTGIPTQIMDTIFDPFFTTKEPDKGTGLGLSTVLGITRTHNGFVRVESKPAEGARFEVYLPVAASEVLKPRATDSSAAPLGQGELILIVDDEASILKVTAKLLESHGYQVLTAADGAEAVAVFAQHQCLIRAVLMDMMMPVMDGPKAIQALRYLNPKVCIIGASGRMPEDQASNVAQLNLPAFLDKPCSAEQLLRTIHQVLHPVSERGLERGSSDPPVPCS